MKTLLIIATLQFALYTIYYLIRWGIPESFSATYLKTRLLFQWIMVTTGAAVMAVSFSLTDGQWWQFTGLFVGFPIMLIGAAPKYYLDDLESGVHYKGAYISAAASLFWVVMASVDIEWQTALVIPVAVVFAAIGYYSNNMKNGTWWWEWAAFLWMFMGVWCMV